MYYLVLQFIFMKTLFTGEDCNVYDFVTYVTFFLDLVIAFFSLLIFLIPVANPSHTEQDFSVLFSTKSIMKGDLLVEFSFSWR